MTTTINRQKEKIEKRKQKLALEQKILKEKERRARAYRWKEIGKLAEKAGIGDLEPEVIFGAFLEIKETHSEKSDSWKQLACFFRENMQESTKEALIISFQSEPDSTYTDKLKAKHFKWNKFRKEFHGYGNRHEIERALDGSDFQLEVVE